MQLQRLWFELSVCLNAIRLPMLYFLAWVTIGFYRSQRALKTVLETLYLSILQTKDLVFGIKLDPFLFFQLLLGTSVCLKLCIWWWDKALQIGQKELARIVKRWSTTHCTIKSQPMPLRCNPSWFGIFFCNLDYFVILLTFHFLAFI